MKNNQINKDNKNNKRKAAIALLAGLAITGLIGASAASLGGIRDASLGADATDVASCDSDGVDVSYETSFVRDITIIAPETDDQGYFDVDKVIVGGVNAFCEGKTYEVRLLDDDNLTLGTATGTVTLVSATDGTILPDDFAADMPVGLVDAEFVTGIAISISG